MTSFSYQRNNRNKEFAGELSSKPSALGLPLCVGGNGFNLGGFNTHVLDCENKSLRGAVVGVE